MKTNYILIAGIAALGGYLYYRKKKTTKTNNKTNNEQYILMAYDTEPVYPTIKAPTGKQTPNVGTTPSVANKPNTIITYNPTIVPTPPAKPQGATPNAELKGATSANKTPIITYNKPQTELKVAQGSSAQNTDIITKARLAAI